jgi:hypothetical protein
VYNVIQSRSNQPRSLTCLYKPDRYHRLATPRAYNKVLQRLLYRAVIRPYMSVNTIRSRLLNAQVSVVQLIRYTHPILSLHLSRNQRGQLNGHACLLAIACGLWVIGTLT